MPSFLVERIYGKTIRDDLMADWQATPDDLREMMDRNLIFTPRFAYQRKEYQLVRIAKWIDVDLPPGVSELPKKMIEHYELTLNTLCAPWVNQTVFKGKERWEYLFTLFLIRKHPVNAKIRLGNIMFWIVLPEYELDFKELSDLLRIIRGTFEQKIKQSDNPLNFTSVIIHIDHSNPMSMDQRLEFIRKEIGDDDPFMMPIKTKDFNIFL